MIISVLKKGDEVLNVTSEFVAVKRERGEVDVIPLIKDTNGLRVDIENIVTIGYGENTVTYEADNGVKIMNF